MPQQILEALTKLNPEITNKAPGKNQKGQENSIFNTNSVQFSPPSELMRSEMSAFVRMRAHLFAPHMSAFDPKRTFASGEWDAVAGRALIFGVIVDEQLT